MSMKDVIWCDHRSSECGCNAVSAKWCGVMEGDDSAWGLERCVGNLSGTSRSVPHHLPITLQDEVGVWWLWWIRWLFLTRLKSVLSELTFDATRPGDLHAVSFALSVVTK